MPRSTLTKWPAICLNIVRDLENEPQGHLKVIAEYHSKIFSEGVCDLQGQGQRSHLVSVVIVILNVRWIQSSNLTKWPAICLDIVRDLENEPQGHLKVIAEYHSKIFSEGVCDLQGQGQRSHLVRSVTLKIKVN